MTDTQTTVWDFLEQRNEIAPMAQDLYSWGLNCDPEGNPWLMFLQIIGWAEEHTGSTMVPDEWDYGFVEIQHLADALTEFTKNPEAVYAWVEKLMETTGV